MSLRQIKTGTNVGTIAWGTGGVMGNGIPAGSIIPSIKLSPKNSGPIEIEDNDGLTAVEVLLRDGFNGKFPTLYDNGKSYPVEGANCALALNFNGANANAIPFGEPGANGGAATVANGVVTYTCFIVALSPAYEKKKEMYIDWDVTYRPNVAV